MPTPARESIAKFIFLIVLIKQPDTHRFESGRIIAGLSLSEIGNKPDDVAVPFVALREKFN